jgi:hypothetical protein
VSFLLCSLGYGVDGEVRVVVEALPAALADGPFFTWALVFTWEVAAAWVEAVEAGLYVWARNGTMA